MTDPDKDTPGGGAAADGPRPEGRPMPFFPGPVPGQAGQVPGTSTGKGAGQASGQAQGPASGPTSGSRSTGGVPLAAPPAPAPAGPASTPPAQSAPLPTQAQQAPPGPPSAPAPASAPADEEGRAAAVTTAVSAAVVKGRITIGDQVIEKIARLAALEVEGVAASSVRSAPPGGADGGAPDEAAGRPGAHGPASEKEVSLDLAVTVEYGRVVMDVAKEVKTNVARVVSRMLGMRVVAVNVSVDDVVLPAAPDRAIPDRAAHDRAAPDRDGTGSG